MKNENQINIYTKVKKSPYWGGGFRGYALNMWDIKYYGFQSEDEIEYASLFFLGQNFEVLHSSLDIKAEFSIEGRSGGWLCTNTKLTKKQLQLVTEYVKDAMKILPEILAEYRQLEGK